MGIERGGMRPAVVLRATLQHPICSGQEGLGAAQGRCVVGRLRNNARAGINHPQRAVRLLEPVAGAARNGGEHNLLHLVGRLALLQSCLNRQVALASAQGRQRLQALRRQQFGVADKEHHHSAEEPERHQHACTHPGPSMHQKHKPLGLGGSPHRRRAQKRWFSVSSTRRPSPTNHCVLV